MNKRQLTLTIRSEGHADQGAATRALRSLLKAMLRCYGYRVVRIEPTQATNELS